MDRQERSSLYGNPGAMLASGQTGAVLAVWKSGDKLTNGNRGAELRVDPSPKCDLTKRVHYDFTGVTATRRDRQINLLFLGVTANF